MFRALTGRMLLIAVTALLPLVASIGLMAVPASADVICADLIVTDITFTPTTPIQDQNTNVAVTVKNQGTCPSTSFVTQWKSAQNAPAGPSESLSSLDANTSHTFNFIYAFPNGGNFLTIATVDSGHQVTELIETNNIATQPVVVSPATVDLTITSVTYAPNPAVATDAMQATVHVVNNGNTASSDFQVSWKPKPTGAALTKLVNGLAAAGGSADVVFDYTYSFLGSYTSTATVDSAKDIKETDETNNVYTQVIEVDPALPDLIISAVTLNPPAPIAGQPMQLVVTVKNVGHRPTDKDFQVDWKPVFGQTLQQQVTGAIPVDGTVDVTFDYTYDRGGNFNGSIVVDSTKQVREVNETNNTQPLQVTVGDADVDLTITDFHVDPSDPIQGQDTTWSVTVKNLGNTDAGSFVVAVNPDSLGISSNGNQTLSTQVDSLAAGAEQTVTFTNYQYSDPGNYRAIAQVDALHNIAETNEANNTALLNIVASPGNIDLQITDITISTDLCAQSVPASCAPMKYWKGSAVTAAITILNNGDYPAGPFSVRWLLQDTDPTFAGKVTSVPGLLAHTSTTVYLHGTYNKDGDFTTKAIVDIYDQVKEGCAGCEANNESTTTLTVLPRDTSVDVTLTNMHDFNDLDDGLAGSGEWRMYLAALSSGDTCHIHISLPIVSDIDEDVKGLKCINVNFDPDGAGDHGPFGPLSLTLKENAPLAIAIFGIEDDLPTGVDNPGFTFQFWLSGDYQVASSVVLKGQKGDSRCSNGECFDATVSVNVTAGPPPPSSSSTSLSTASSAVIANVTEHSLRNVITTVRGSFGFLGRTRDY